MDQPLKMSYPNLFQLEVVKNCSVKDILEGQGLWLWGYDPNTEDELSELGNLRNKLLDISLSNRSNSWRWLGDRSGSFSVGSVKKLIIDSSNFSGRFVMEWSKWVPLKCNVFAWRAGLYRIPTVDALIRRGIPIDNDACSFYNSADESFNHIFSAYIVSTVLWQKISAWCRISNVFAFSFCDLLDIHNHSGKTTREKDALLGIIVASCWCLWKARNDLRISGKQAKVQDIFSEVQMLGFL
ncbi:putative reverse transcriptase zinc-binding domain-containing protein [Helianthus anomalus]